MSRSILVLLLGALGLALALGLAGCTHATSPAQTAAIAPRASTQPISGEITIFVPCGVAGPYGEIRDLFHARYPNVKIKQDLGNIDVQTRKIESGKATPDVWLSLGDREMDRAIKAGKIDGKPVTYAYNSIAFMVAKNNPLQIESVQGLTKPGVKTIALASTENSSGYYAKQAFQKAGIWDKIQNKLWVTDHPAEVEVQASSGKAQVGVVYYPCAHETHHMDGKPEEVGGKLTLLGKLPANLVGRIPAEAAVIKGCSNPAAGHAFINMLLDDKVQDIWEKWSFDRVKPAKGAHTVLYLYCGAGIRPFIDPAVSAFEKKDPQVHVDVGYAGSGCLLSQLTFSKRGDLYMPGENFYINQAVKRGFVTKEEPVAYFAPVLLVQKGNPKGIKTPADLARPGLRVGIGEPEACAVGRAAEAMLKKAGVYSKVKPNIVLRAGNVPELGNDVKLKALDVAVVWNLTAAQLTSSCDAIKIDPKLYQPSLIPIGLLKFTTHQPEAQAFMDFLNSPAGQAIVKKSGLAPAKGEMPAGT